MSGRVSIELPNDPCALRLADGAVVRVRAIRPGDSDRLAGYLKNLSAESRRNRMLGAMSELPRPLLERMSRMTGVGGLTLVAFAAAECGISMIAETMQIDTPNHACLEVAISVADPWQRRGLGTLLLRNVERRARQAGVRRLFGDVLRTNHAMKALARKQGFAIQRHLADPTMVTIVKDLASAGRRCDADDNAGELAQVAAAPSACRPRA